MVHIYTHAYSRITTCWHRHPCRLSWPWFAPWSAVGLAADTDECTLAVTSKAIRSYYFVSRSFQYCTHCTRKHGHILFSNLFHQQNFAREYGHGVMEEYVMVLSVLSQGAALLGKCRCHLRQKGLVIRLGTPPPCAVLFFALDFDGLEHACLTGLVALAFGLAKY